MSTQEAIFLRNAHEKELRHIPSTDLYRLMWFLGKREMSGQAKIRAFGWLDPDCYQNPCATHWGTDCLDFYDKLSRRLQDVFRKNPCAQFDDLNRVLAKVPDPPLGCKPGPQGGEEIDCPLRPSFIRRCLTLLAKDLNDINNTLIESAFEKKF